MPQKITNVTKSPRGVKPGTKRGPYKKDPETQIRYHLNISKALHRAILKAGGGPNVRRVLNSHYL